MSDMSLWLAGSAGQAALARSAAAAGLRAAVDQHEATVRDALGEPVTAEVLMSYARGFVEAAVASGWWPSAGSAESDRLGAGGLGLGAGGLGAGGLGAGGLDDEMDWLDAVIAGAARDLDGGLDWESLRLAAVCRLFLETQGLAI